MTEGQPQPAPLDLRELEKEASQLIGIFTQKSQIEGSRGFESGGSYFFINHIVKREADKLIVSRFPSNGGYGEEHLYIESPSNPAYGNPVIRFEVYFKGKDYQQMPDSVHTNSREAVENAKKLLSRIPEPVAA